MLSPRSLYSRDYRKLAPSDFPDLRRQHVILDALGIPRMKGNIVLYLGSRMDLLNAHADPQKRIAFRLLREATADTEPTSRFGDCVRIALERIERE